MRVIAQLLRSSTVVTTLGLHGVQIGAWTAVLAGALQGNTNVTTLDLSHNNIDDEGAQALAGALQGNTSVTTLHLRSNNIGSDGAQALARALQGNTTLTTLDLSWNNIAPGGAAALAGALRGNTTLTTLRLQGNNIGDEGAAALAGLEIWMKACCVYGLWRPLGWIFLKLTRSLNVTLKSLFGQLRDGKHEGMLTMAILMPTAPLLGCAEEAELPGPSAAAFSARVSRYFFALTMDSSSCL